MRTVQCTEISILYFFFARENKVDILAKQQKFGSAAAVLMAESAKKKFGSRFIWVSYFLEYITLSLCTYNCSYSSWVLKVTWFWKQIVKPWILPRNEQMTLFLLACDMFSFVFWKKLKAPKRQFEIIWPLLPAKCNFS